MSYKAVVKVFKEGLDPSALKAFQDASRGPSGDKALEKLREELMAPGEVAAFTVTAIDAEQLRQKLTGVLDAAL
ncbi:hypothetical protein SEA_APIARY_6 [Rhodococcus phage Apiary]|nr:hypothetical protein SEA_BRAXOADDIE_6 [Rhodococcus phage Braxoaddie]WNM64929.1 hypothetical protein SEA_MASELOP_6 [Rhodococcus phage Maselop]WNM67390.1 hypothetical protein SEA_POLYYUKI_6 [Rhodococcus phage Polyyuki]WNM69814.1 hypothetical protein SEA_APIARY_6 [Rhodococcus phage Apiary]